MASPARSSFSYFILFFFVFFFNDTATTEIYTLSLHDALPISKSHEAPMVDIHTHVLWGLDDRSEEHTSELQSPCNLVCRLLLEKKKEHERRVDRQGHPYDRWFHAKPNREREVCQRADASAWCSGRAWFAFFFFNDTATTEIYTLSLHDALPIWVDTGHDESPQLAVGDSRQDLAGDRKSTRLNSSHLVISYAVFCLKKKKK